MVHVCNYIIRVVNILTFIYLLWTKSRRQSKISRNPSTKRMDIVLTNIHSILCPGTWRTVVMQMSLRKSYCRMRWSPLRK